MANASLQYYTDRVDESLAQTVRGIRGQHEEFATDYLGDPSQDKDSRICIRLVAWQQDETGFWQIDRYTVLGADAEDAVKKERETKSDLCFFDALEYCASFEMAQKEIGKVSFQVAEPDDIVSFKTAAKAAGQVIDADGRLHPCARGRIIGDGFFSKSDIALARQTRTVKVEPVSQPQQSSALALILSGKDASETEVRDIAGQVTDRDMIKVLRNKDDLVRAYKKAIHNGTNMLYVFNRATKNDFKYGLDVPETLALGALGIASLGYMPMKRLVKGDALLAPVKGFYRAKSNFLRAVQDLPDEQLITRLNDFAREVSIAFQMEQAAALVKDHNERTAGNLKKALAYASAACQEAGYNDADTQRIKKALTDGEINQRQFYAEISSQWDPFLRSTFPIFENGTNLQFDWAELYLAVKEGVDKNASTYDLRDLMSPQRKQFKGAVRWAEDDNFWGRFVDAIHVLRRHTQQPSFVNEMAAQICKLDINKASPS